MKRKGFTLIELLAVIIILAVIALITTPIVLNVVDEAKKGAFSASVNGVIDAIRYNTIEAQFAGNTVITEYTFPSENIKVQGSQPSGGTASVDKDGNIQIAVYDGKWCAVKGYTDSVITVNEYVEGECELEEKENVLSGTWKFNDVLTASDVGLVANVNFTVQTSVSELYEGIAYCDKITVTARFEGAVTEYWVNLVNYNILELVPSFDFITTPVEITMYQTTFFGGNVGGAWDTNFYGEGIKTITFTEEQEVSPEFYTWFTANATKQ